MHFEFQFDARLLEHRAPHAREKRGDVGRARVVAIDDKIRVQLGDLGAAFAPAFRAGRFDQPAGLVVRRVAEARQRMELPAVARKTWGTDKSPAHGPPGKFSSA